MHAVQLRRVYVGSYNLIAIFLKYSLLWWYITWETYAYGFKHEFVCCCWQLTQCWCLLSLEGKCFSNKWFSCEMDGLPMEERWAGDHVDSTSCLTNFWQNSLCFWWWKKLSDKLPKNLQHKHPRATKTPSTTNFDVLLNNSHPDWLDLLLLCDMCDPQSSLDKRYFYYFYYFVSSKP